MKSTLINTRAFDMNNIDAINNKPIQIQCFNKSKYFLTSSKHAYCLLIPTYIYIDILYVIEIYLELNVYLK